MDPNFDLVPTLRMFDGLIMDKAADEIERLRKELGEARRELLKQATSVLQKVDAPAQRFTVVQFDTGPMVAALRDLADQVETKRLKYENGGLMFSEQEKHVVMSAGLTFSRNVEGDST